MKNLEEEEKPATFHVSVFTEKEKCPCEQRHQEAKLSLALCVCTVDIKGHQKGRSSTAKVLKLKEDQTDSLTYNQHTQIGRPGDVLSLFF